MGGTTNVLPPSGSGGATGTATGSGGRAGGAGSTSSDGGNGGLDGDLPAAPGETGIFVGMTAAHNAVRQGLDLDPPLPDLTWNQDLSDFAQQWADTLANSTNCGTIFHRDQRMYGENIAFAGIKGAGTIMYPPEDAVASWAEEVLCWDYGTILGNGQPTASSESCDAKCIAAQHSSGCGHYTQLVWRNTREVGCGYATCVSSDGFSDGIWVCNYSPPGNFIGQTPY
ncbi:MAG TPA: CAP domain-containing protein [Polyangiaceae bacterium]|nr:CAP domain-containing protein [Polyangiaceae bacterium]